jgi:nitronate monooxygenase
MFKTRLTKLLGIEHPIVQVGMLWIARAELVAAVSNAGGLGILSCLTYPTKEEFRQEVRKLKSLTDRPFGINLPFMPMQREVRFEDYVEVGVEEKVAAVETWGRVPDHIIEAFKQGNVKMMHKIGTVRQALRAQDSGYDAVIADDCFFREANAFWIGGFIPFNPSLHRSDTPLLRLRSEAEPSSFHLTSSKWSQR